eukprot:scaffold166295_cov32-Tisochrysis_lutea.AAC.2
MLLSGASSASCTASQPTLLTSPVSSGGGSRAGLSRAHLDNARFSTVLKPSTTAESFAALQHGAPHKMSGQRGSCVAKPLLNRAIMTSERSSGCAGALTGTPHL